MEFAALRQAAIVMRQTPVSLGEEAASHPDAGLASRTPSGERQKLSSPQWKPDAQAKSLVAWRAEVKAPMPTKNDGDAAKPKGKGKGKKRA